MAPVLAHYNASLKTWVETDSSDFVTADVLSQMHNGVFRPVAFFLKKMLPVECNYMIYDKELLAIVKSFEMWRPELISVDQLIKVYIDHKNLKHFMTIKQLNRRQACWAKFLSEFNFKISYRSGKQGEKLDVLTCWSQDLPKGIKDLRQQYQFQTLLQDHQLNKDIKKALAVTFYVNTANETINNAVDKTIDANEENKEIINVKNFFDKFSNPSFFTLLQQIIFEPIKDRKSETDETEGKSLEKLFNKAYKNDKIMKEIIHAKAHGLRKLPTALTKKSIVLSMRDLKIGKNRRLYVKNRIYVSENKLLQLFLLQQYHNPPIHSHSGYKAMYRTIQANYFWFEIAKHCKQYASNCLTCRRTKAYTIQKQSLLNLLPISNRK